MAAAPSNAELDALDYYALLGVERDATADAVKRAFHDFARRYHPDRYLADPEQYDRMMALYRRGTEAYRVLSDPGSRRLYAQCLEQGITRYDPSVARQSQRPTKRPATDGARVAVPGPARVPGVAKARDPRDPREQSNRPTPAAGTKRSRAATSSSERVPRSASERQTASERPAVSASQRPAATTSQRPASVTQRPVAARSSTPPSRTPPSPSLADGTTGRAREFALRAQQALETRQYRSARLSLRLALSHDEGNTRLAEELAKLEKKLGLG